MRRIRVFASHVAAGANVNAASHSAIVSPISGAAALTRLDVGSGAVATLSLCRSEKLNTLSLSMLRTLQAQYAELSQLAVRCVLLRGEGRAFCAGGDVASLREGVLQESVYTAELFFDEYRLDYQIATLYNREKIVQVALWDGIVMGGGVGLSLHCPIRVATEKTLFAMPETAIGFFPDVGATWALSRLRAGMSIGLMLGLTGMRLGAADCLFAGLATHYCPSTQLEALKTHIESLGDLANDLDAVAAAISAVGAAMPDTKQAVLEDNMGSIERCFGIQEQPAEEILARLEQEGSEWAAGVAQTLRQRSPTSVKVTLEAMRRHSHKAVSLGEALNTEYRISQWFMKPAPHSDFCEGVRAVLVDKGSTPQWGPSSLAEVSMERVEGFFAPLPADHFKGELGL